MKTTTRHSLGRTPRLTFATVALLLFCSAKTFAQPPRINPFSEFVAPFVKVGEMNDSSLTGGVHPVGDCNHDGLQDWILPRLRRDTVIDHFGLLRLPLDMVLYKGVRNGLPNLDDGIRIGLTEAGVLHQFLASGDWDDDGNLDIAIRTMKLNDSTYGTRGASQFDLIVFWGNMNGNYSLADTSRLMSRGDAWIWAGGGVSGDIDNNGVDDLLIHGSGPRGGIARLIGGDAIPAPTMSLFLGHAGQRWGRDGLGHRADWEWWEQPFDFNRIGEKLIDQNCDNAPDLVLYLDDPDDDNHSRISILYGTPGGGLPDTNDVESIDLSTPWPPVETAQLLDATGDGVLDLVVLESLILASFDAQSIRVYPGEPGQRIAELYGTGANPWANFPTPGTLHDGWGGFRNRLYDLGTANPKLRPTNRDIWAYHHPFLVSYATGRDLDSLIDGYYRFDGLGPQTFVPLGDIDGSGVPTIAVGYTSLEHGSGVIYLKGSDSAFGYGFSRRDLPHPAGIRCSSTVSVKGDEWRVVPEESLGLSAVPNPSSGDVRIWWNGNVAGASVRISEALGKQVETMTIRPDVQGVTWDASAIPDGSYFITLTIGDHAETVRVVLQR